MVSSTDNKIMRMQRARASRSSSFLFLSAIVLWVGQAAIAGAFVPTTLTPGSKQTDFTSGSISTTTRSRSELLEPSYFASCRRINSNNRKKQKSTELYFMGSDGGILGIGTPELVRFSLLITVIVIE